ncbi:MAG: hypothetical protein ACLPH3_21080 [Terracidiphilus sp.]
MNTRLHVPLVLMASAITALQSAALEPVRAACSISVSEQPGKYRLHIDRGDCGSEHWNCGSSDSEESIDRFKGITPSDLARDGAQLTVALTAEAGTFTCSGTVHVGSLTGDSLFVPDAAFAARMEQMGFSGLESETLQTYALVNVKTQWAHSLQEIGIPGITADNLIPLRIFRVDPEYVNSITALGYELPTADQLIAMRVQGVDAAEVREIRSLGYHPNFDELIQIRIFKITPEFIRRMEARGLKDLTIAKLVQIRIFKLDE